MNGIRLERHRLSTLGRPHHEAAREPEIARARRLTWISLVCAAAILVGCSSSRGATTSTASSTSAPTGPRLILSRYHAAPGQNVRVKGENCPRPYKQADELTWHDSYQLAHRNVRPAYRLVQPLHRAGEAVTAVFVVRRTDHPGRGLLDLFCGGKGQATAYLTVTR